MPQFKKFLHESVLDESIELSAFSSVLALLLTSVHLHRANLKRGEQTIKQMRKHKITKTHPQRWKRQIEVLSGHVSHRGF